MSPDFGPKPAIESDQLSFQPTGESPSTPEDIPIDEELATAVQGLFDRLGGRTRMWHIVYELHGERTLDPSEAEDLRDRMADLAEAGRVVAIGENHFAAPGSPDAIWHDRQKAAGASERPAEPVRRTSQTPEEVEAMMRREFGGSRGRPYRTSGREGRRGRRH